MRGSLWQGPELSCPLVLSPSTHPSASPDLASFTAAASPPAPHMQGGLAPLPFCGVPPSQSHSEDFRSTEAKQPLCWRWGLPLQWGSYSSGPPPPSPHLEASRGLMGPHHHLHPRAPSRLARDCPGDGRPRGRLLAQLLRVWSMLSLRRSGRCWVTPTGRHGSSGIGASGELALLLPTLV